MPTVEFTGNGGQERIRPSCRGSLTQGNATAVADASASSRIGGELAIRGK